MNITVILCTYNRCRTLEKALSSVAASTLPESIEWEVLVVDNNSRDQTRDVVERLLHPIPRSLPLSVRATSGQVVCPQHRDS